MTTSEFHHLLAYAAVTGFVLAGVVVTILTWLADRASAKPGQQITLRQHVQSIVAFLWSAARNLW